ncbi:NAD-dependent epimerase/dehydratase family protein [Pedobacter hartonius]|uniref:UDP-glucose 4-epimerase n=1 Tax=Pedobacter hartonius TaxID=425514 RepID=A0A1H4FR52_9SPHI|nr:NAD-dependent epimerase/dehydratase family protein [Pedobacter hartonius]SEA99775.1 UDP-glucose 4-epimerase [Pedobacter hartonius]
MIKKKILLIGGGGFIGTNLVKYVFEELVEEPIDLVIVSRTKKNDQYTQNNIRYENGDYMDIIFLDKLFSREQFTHVFHFASTTVPVSSNQNIIGDIKDNLIATVNLLEIMKQHACNFILYLSSGGAVYGEFKQDSLDEQHPCEPISSYGVVKYTIEQYIKLYHRQNGLNYLILRISNPYGPFHVSEKQGVVNIAIRKAINKQPLVVWGTGEQSKDYIFVEDIIQIIWLLMKSDVKNEIFNIGSGNTITLNSILGSIKSLIPDFKVSYESSRPADVMKFSLDISKLNKQITFDMTSIEDGLTKTLEWEYSQKGINQ